MKLGVVRGYCTVCPAAGTTDLYEPDEKDDWNWGTSEGLACWKPYRGGTAVGACGVVY